VATTKGWLRVFKRASAASALALGLGAAGQDVGPGTIGAFYRLDADRESGVFVDRTSAVRHGDLEFFRQTTAYAHAQGTSRRYSIVMTSWEVDCAAPREKSIGVSHYDDDGRLLDHKAADPNNWESIYPGSPLDSLRARLCGDAPWPDNPDFVGTQSQLRAAFVRGLGPAEKP
jgi:hypothetical protein